MTDSMTAPEHLYVDTHKWIVYADPAGARIEYIRADLAPLKAVNAEVLAKVHYELCRAVEPKWFGGTPVCSWEQRSANYRDECIGIMRAALASAASDERETT